MIFPVIAAVSNRTTQFPIRCIAPIPNFGPYDSTGYGGYSNQNALRTVLGQVGALGNPVARAKEDKYQLNQRRVLGNAFLEWEITTGLRFRTMFGVDAALNRTHVFNSSINALTGAAPSTIPSGSASSSEELDLLNENLLTYETTIKGDHRISAIAGYSAQRNDFKFISTAGTQYPNDNIQYVSAAGIITGGTEQRSSLSEIKDPAAAFVIKRSTEAEVYEAISKNLLDAIATLPVSHTSANLGRITQGAAKALLAKAYLTNKKADLALPLLRQLTTTPYIYRLMGTFPRVFTDNTAESLFEIQYLSGITNNEGNPLANFFLSNDASVGKDIFGAAYAGSPGSGFLLATPDLYNSYEATDTRRIFSYLQYRSVNEGANVYLVRKYYKLPSTGLGGSDDNVIIIRFADVLLMLAEAINETGGPTPESYDAVDKVRIRAGVAVWPRNLSADIFKTRLFEERRRELAFEFHRWFDLKRSGKLIEPLKAKGYPVQPHYTLFPVPRGQVTINPVNVPQNPGY